MSRRHRPTASAERPPGTAEYWALEMSEWGSELEPEFTLVYPGAAKDVVEIDEGRVLHKPKHELREDDPRRASLQAKRQALLDWHRFHELRPVPFNTSYIVGASHS